MICATSFCTVCATSFPRWFVPLCSPRLWFTSD
jgi:hypothetical protein